MVFTRVVGRYRRAAIYRLLLLNYGRAQRWYWELRTPDLHRHWGEDRADFTVLSDILGRYHPQSVLDLGCGTGRLFPLYKEAGIRKVLGVDIAGRALGIASRLYPGVPTQRVRAEKLRTHERFDMVVINRVLQHLLPENLPAALDRVTSIGSNAIYINEIGKSDTANLTGARYMFEHDYVPMLAARGWCLSEQGEIPGSRQTYLLFTPMPGRVRRVEGEVVQARGLASVRPMLRPIGRPLNRLIFNGTRLRLRWIYLREDIDGVQGELRHLRSGHADALRQFDAQIARDAMIVGPLSIVNARTDFSNLTIGPKTHVGSEVFIDLADHVTIEEGATISMRVCIISHLDVGRGPMANERPRQTGEVTIGAGAFIGAGAIILHGVTIGPGAVVPAGAVVHKDVAGGSIVTRSGMSRSAFLRSGAAR